MKITLVQSRGLMQDPTVNYFKARMRVNNIDSDMFIFPEMFCSGYSGDEEILKIGDLKTKILDRLSTLSDFRGSAIIAGCPVKEGDKIYNAAYLIDADKQYVYKKMKLTSEGPFDETKVFTPGNQPMIVNHQGVKIGMSIGDDLLMHSLFNFYGQQGCDIIVCISAYTDKQIDKFEKIVMCRAAENNIPIILCNMVGNDCGVKMAGRSKYIDADGNIAESCTDSSDVRTITIDEEQLNEIRARRKPITDVEFGECLKYDSHSHEGRDPSEVCTITGV